MHEASLMTGLIRQIEQIARAEQGQRIVGVSVRLGALCHMSAEHFAEHFRHASDNTIARGAELRVTLSEDTQDPNAQDILLEAIEVET